MIRLVNHLRFDLTGFKVYSQSMKSREVRELAEKYRIIRVYLFGSQAEKGAKYLEGANTRPDEFSDLDVAVAFNNSPSNAINIYARLYKDLSEIFDYFSIDLIFMHEVDPLFQYEIIKGIRIFEKDASSADEFEERIMKMAEDLAFKKMILNREILEAIKDGYFEFGYIPPS